MSTTTKIDRRCPWCHERLHLVREASYGYHDYSYIECANQRCPVQPRGKRMDNTTWTQGEGTRTHPEETEAKLVEAWRVAGDCGCKIPGCSFCDPKSDDGPPEELFKVVYLGDGVYAGVDRPRRLWIYLDDGIQKTHAICLEPEVVLALEMHLDVQFPKRRKKP